MVTIDGLHGWPGLLPAGLALGLVSLLFPVGAQAQEGSSQEPGWEEVLPGLEVQLPRDHGAHFGHRTEWWYFTGHLEAEDGHELGYQFTIFRSGIDARPLEQDGSLLRARQVYAGHLALADITDQRFLVAERLRRATPGFAEASEEDMEVRLEDWTISRSPDDGILLVGSGDGGGFQLALELSPQKPLVLHGAGGYSRKGEEPGNASGYTSWTRLATRGTAVVGGKVMTVTGSTWYDHEWGTSQLGEGIVGWDWFSLQLDDERELMVYGLRREDGTFDRFSSGTLVEADGSSRKLEPEEFRIEPTGSWSSPVSGGSYPSGWIVEAAGLRLEVSPQLAGCELDTSGSTGVSYWEGPVLVRGDASGRGYVELTGYADSLERRF